MRGDLNLTQARARLRGRAAGTAESTAVHERQIIDLSAVIQPSRPRPTTPHLAAVPRLDGQMRACVATLASALDWQVGQRLVVELSAPGVATIGPFQAQEQSPLQHRVRLDAQSRITLPVTIRAALDLASGDQVLFLAQPATGLCQLRSAAVTLAELTGALEFPDALALSQQSDPTRRGGPAPAWRPEAG